MGNHRADRKGSGVEFAGHRAYTPGDDLRHLDRHALLRHRKLLIREFLTDTERSVHLVIDATESMRYRSSQGPAAGPWETKLERALLLSGALAFVARSAGDHLGLSVITESGEHTRKPRAGSEAFDRIVHELEELDESNQTMPADKRPPPDENSTVNWDSLLGRLGSAIPRGALIFVFSDFLDLNPKSSKALASLCTQRRVVRAVQVLSTDEVDFPFEGALRLKDPETGQEVETDAAQVRAAYQNALGALTENLRSDLLARGGALYRTLTDSPPDEVLRAVASGRVEPAP